MPCPCIPFLRFLTKESQKHAISLKNNQLFPIVSLLCTAIHMTNLFGFPFRWTHSFKMSEGACGRLNFSHGKRKKKKVLHLACPFLFSLLSLLSRRRRRNMKSQECRGDVYTHCLRRAVSLAKEGRPQFTRPAFNFAHQTMAVYTAPFKAGKMQHNVTRTSSIGPSGGGRVPNNDSLVIMEPLFFLLARCGNTRRRGEGG